MSDDNPHIGSSFDDWLKDQGIYEQVTTHAIGRVRAWQASNGMDTAKPQRTVEIIVPPGYRSADDFLVDCSFERASQPPLASTPEMRNRLRELAQPARDDFDRAVLIVLDDLERLVRRYGLG